MIQEKIKAFKILFDIDIEIEETNLSFKISIRNPFDKHSGFYIEENLNDNTRIEERKLAAIEALLRKFKTQAFRK